MQLSFLSLRLNRPLALLACIALALCTLASGAQSITSARFPLQLATVAAALQQAGLHVSAGQVRLPSPLSSGSASPALQVTAAEWLPGGGMRVRLTCKVAGECLAFYALIDASAENTNAALAETAALHASPAVPSSMPLSSAAPAPTVVRAGVHTTLLMEGPHMRITLPVITLDSGAVGSEVRLSSLDRKITYRGVIEGPQIVRGDLP